MQKLVSSSVGALLLSLLVIPHLNCAENVPAGYDSCVPVQPDGGTNPDLACDVGWSCNGDGTHYELACTFQAGDFACTCYADGAATKTFSVNAFTCDSNGALPSAQSGCGWYITLE